LVRSPTRFSAFTPHELEWSEHQAVIDGRNYGVAWPYPDPARLACRQGETSTPRERIEASLVLDALAGDCPRLDPPVTRR